MAAHNPIDPLSGSQDFYESFYSFHKKLPYPWYIKDKHHLFTDMSDSFCEQFLPDDTMFEDSVTDYVISGSGLSTISLMHAFESLAIKRWMPIRLLASGYFFLPDSDASYLINLHPVIFSGSSFVFAYVCPLTSPSESFHIIHKIIDAYFPAEIPTVAHVLCSIKNPTKFLSEEEWEIVWLKLSGRSFRQISTFHDIKSKTFEKKLDHIYHKLKLFGSDALLRASEQNAWMKYIPPAVLKNQKIIRIP